uniref:Secreted protein n=1 Tax=Anguilla anguilla TaxID=7936 RepID=A0A0E9WW83_ANGAN
MHILFNEIFFGWCIFFSGTGTALSVNAHLNAGCMDSQPVCRFFSLCSPWLPELSSLHNCPVGYY